MADIGLSAFSLFFMQSESFLSHQRRLEQGHGTSNCQTLFGMEKIPTDNHIRTLLDAVSPEALQPCFDQILEQLRQRNGLKAFQRLAGRTLVALDGTEYFCSQKLSCQQCLTRKLSLLSDVRNVVPWHLTPLRSMIIYFTRELTIKFPIQSRIVHLVNSSDKIFCAAVINARPSGTSPASPPPPTESSISIVSF
jgi:hypothetical protein